MSRRESVGRASTRKQSASGPPIMEMVTVAVLPPRLPPNFAPPTGVGMADVFSWDESINWQHNNPIPPEGEAGRKKSLRKKIGLTTERKRANPDIPPFIMRQVPYQTWRKHYAKDKDGNYKGSHAPAEDCLLKPEDVQKWRFEEATTMADKWTRGSEVLPVYAEVQESGRVPEYEVDYDGPPRDEPIVTPEEDGIASRSDIQDTTVRQRQEPGVSTQRTPREPAAAGRDRLPGERVQNFKPPKDTWKKKLQRGLEMATMGG